jgi:uncharacterized protein
MPFDSDPDKAAENLKRHRVSFEEAVTVFRDPLSRPFPDPEHPEGGKHYLDIGHSERGRLLIVSSTERQGAGTHH